MSLTALAARIAKLEQKRGASLSHVLFGHSHDDVEAQRVAMIRAGTAAERDEFVMFVTIYEQRPQ